MKAIDKAIRACDVRPDTKSGELGGIKYYIVAQGDGYFEITMNGKSWKRNARLGTMEAAEKNVRNAIGEVLSWERATGKKANIRDANANPDKRVHQIVGPYSVQWDEHDGYFKVRKNGKVVAYAPNFEDARRQAWRLNAADE